MQAFRLVVAAVAALFVLGAGIAFAADEFDQSASEPPGVSATLDDPPVELESKRTATSQTFRLPDGSLEARIYETPIHYRDTEGEWQQIGTGFHETDDQALTNGPNRFDVSLPEQVDADPIRLSVGDEWVASQLVGTSAEAVELEGKTASYEATQAEVSFDITGLANGIKENIEIADLSQPTTYSFDLSASAGLTPTLEEDGAIYFRDEEGKAVVVLPAPVMSDSAPIPATSRAIHYELEPGADGHWQLKVEAEHDWLSQPERVWPVKLDPSMAIVGPSLDCVIGGSKGEVGWRDCAAWGRPDLSAAYWPKVEAKYDHWARTLMRFDTSTIPESAYVTSATLGLNSLDWAQNTSGVELREVPKPWTWEATWSRYDGPMKLWTNEGGDYTQSLGQITTAQRGTQPGWWQFNVPATAVEQWIAKSEDLSLMVKLLDDKSRVCGPTSCTERFVLFASSAAALTANRPYLQVYYDPAAPSTSKVTSPEEGTRTARWLKLKAAWAGTSTTGVTFQYRTGGTGPYKTVPTKLTRTGGGQEVSWPLTVSDTESTPVYFDAANATEELKKSGGEIEIRARFNAPTGEGGVSLPVKANVNRNTGGTRDAIADVGPGAVNLLTGNLTVARTDVSIPAFGSALEFSRTSNSRDPGPSPDTSILGRGWTTTAPVEAAGSSWQDLRYVAATSEEKEEGFGDYALLTDLESYEYVFEVQGTSYVTPPEMSGWILGKAGADFQLTDADGNRTTFMHSGNSLYVPTSVSQTGGKNNRTRMVYESAGGKWRLKRIIGPSAPEIPCGDTLATSTVGCRTLEFTYKDATDWGAPESFADRLYGITFYGANTAGTMVESEIARYKYDTQGRLIEAWDPRITPNLKETYTYGTSDGILRKITPPGEEPWTLEYDESKAETEGGRLLRVKRPSLLASPSTAQTTIAYGVPLSKTPYDLSPAAVATWGQKDAPTDATAIFPPDQIPANPPTSYSRATVYYMDPDGLLVNTATPSGAGTTAPSITTTETDEHGNVIRELSAQNRLRALAAGSGSAAKSEELDTKRLFSTDGTEMKEEWGPLHEVRLESGSLVEARMHKTIQYDYLAPEPPAGTPKPHLPTTETVGARVKGQTEDVDQKVTETKYDWALRKPTDVIIDAGNGHLNLRTHTEYDPATGLPTERRLPANPNGGDARSTVVRYFEAEDPSDPQCKSEIFAELPCKVMPAKQPGTAGQPDLPVARYASYNVLGQPTEVIESPGGSTQNVRKTTTTYDAAGRPMGSKVEGAGTPILPTEMTYSTTTGRPLTQRFKCEACDDQAVTTTYDKLGRVTTHKDADGNTATTTYDLLSRPVIINDGKGIQYPEYDPTSGLLIELYDTHAGEFTAEYDADGNLVKQRLPNGLLATTTYDEAGQPVHLSYVKTTSCSTECTWLDFDAERSITGQVLAQTSTLSSQQYSYDGAGRLTQVKDTPKGGSCTTRSYEYDENSNRTSFITRGPGIGGVCNTTSAGTTQTYKYDAGDRLLATGLTYDHWGRTTSVPASYAGGSTLTTSYFSNDMVATQSQGSITNTFQLDAMLRQRQRVQTGGVSGTEVFHYANNSDSPAWTERAGTWTRNITGIGGELAAIKDSVAGTSLQLTNLHGDVIATASLSHTATKPTATFEFDEFGNPKQGVAPRFGWLGGKQRRTELPSGVIQMGARSYVPGIGRFTSVDPVVGGSANAYEYALGDPVNGFDLDGEKAKKRKAGLGGARRAARVGTGRPKVAGASRITLRAVKDVIRNLRDFLSDDAKIAWNSCIPQTEIDPVRGELIDAFGGTCIPKVRDYVFSLPEATAAKANGWAWCVLVNAWGAFGHILSFSWAALKAGAYCSGNDGERPWAYVKTSAYTPPS